MQKITVLEQTLLPRNRFEVDFWAKIEEKTKWRLSEAKIEKKFLLQKKDNKIFHQHAKNHGPRAT